MTPRALAIVLMWRAALSLIGAVPERTALPGHIPAVVARLKPVGSMPPTTNLSLALGLPLRDPSGLDALLRQLQDPKSTNYHRYLTPQQFTRRFGPTEEQYQAVIQFAQSNGFSVTGTHGNRVVLDVEAGVGDIERAFQTTLRTYRHPTESRDFYAPDAEPSVPDNVPVLDVGGLSDFGRPRPLLRPARRPGVQPLSGSGPGGLYAGADFRNAYVPGTALSGAGQAVGLLQFSAYFSSDITNYENTIGLTNYVPLVNVIVDHGPGPSTANNAEVALDIEMVIAMAPGLSQVIVYEANSINPATILNRMASDNLAKQLSCSWGWGGGPNSTVDNIFQQMAAQGQSFFQASGDSDAYTGAHLLDDPNQPVAPMDSPYITVVGGTTLTASGSGSSWSSETVWNYHPYGGSFANLGSSGGISGYYPIPWWQTNVSMAANAGSKVWRNIPDVALTADQIYVAYNNGSSGGFAGTSCAAPLWAGFCALVNQQAIATGGPTVGFLNPVLYAIANRSDYSNCFHDITTGNNIGTNAPGLYYAVSNYDLCTGLGTPQGSRLIDALVPHPYLSSQPGNRTVTNGSTVAFSILAGGQAPLNYQWRKDGAALANGGNVSGATSNLLTLASVTVNNAGSYLVVVTNTYGSSTSTVATLTVVVPPSFVVQPTNQTVAAGNPAILGSSAVGDSPLAYQWRKDGIDVPNGGNVSGATSNVLTLAATTLANAGSYALFVTNPYGSATSSAAVLTVTQPPTISVPPSPQSVQCGGNALFSVTANGTPPLAYQWSLDGVPIQGATGTNLVLSDIRLPGHTVTIAVTNSHGGATNSVTLTVQDTLPPVITLNGGNPIHVELGKAFTDPGATALDSCSGFVLVDVTGTVNTGTVGTNTLAYRAQDGNGNTNVATRSVIVQDTTPPTIQWRFTNLVLAADTNCTAMMPDVTGTNCLVATDSSGPPVISQTPARNTAVPLGTNIVVIAATDGSGNAAYSTNTIVVQDQAPPVIGNQPSSQTNNAGATVVFSIVATDCSPINFQWYFNDSPLPGGTNAALTLSNLNSTLAGNYFAIVTAAGGSNTSAVAVLTVNPLLPSLVLASPENPAGFRDTLTFLATVMPTNATGFVQFFTNTSAFATEALIGANAVSTGINTLPRGTNIITAVYSGDTRYLPVTNTLTQVITNHPPAAGALFTNRYAGFPLLLPLVNLVTNWSDLDGDAVSLAGISLSTNGVAVANQNGTLLYSNANDLNDVFVCTLSDGWGGTNYQSVNIAVVPLPANAIPTITSVLPFTNDSVRLELTGSPDFTYVLQTTTDLAEPDGWLPIVTNTPDTNGVWQFLDGTTNGPQRFYRLKLAQ